MTIEELKKLNSDIPIFTVNSPEFADYGRIVELDVGEIIAAGELIEKPEIGARYEASTQVFEKLSVAEEIKNRYFGQMPTQVGYCWGHSNFMNAWEWHTSSEINIAVTDLILILGKVSDMNEYTVDSSTAKAFFLKKGDCVEVYATSLHFCPCEVSENGFGCIVALPRGTNTPLDIETSDKKLTHKNKWLIAHCDNETMLKNGRVAGITGKNLQIRYKEGL